MRERGGTVVRSFSHVTVISRRRYLESAPHVRDRPFDSLGVGIVYGD